MDIPFYENHSYNLHNILALFLGCSDNRDIEGNYSFCKNGVYLETYFKKDSIRIASDNRWVRLSKWREIKIKDDTLHFVTFGEWSDSSKAGIKYVGNKIELHFLKSKNNLTLETDR
jgi:hypothetical protein